MGLSKKVTVIGLSSVVLVAVVVAVAVSVTKNNNHGGANNGNGNGVSTSSKAIITMCQPTDYKDACVKSLSSCNSTDPKDLIKTGFKVAMIHITDVVGKSKTLQDAAKDQRTKQAYDVCKDLLKAAVDDLERSIDKVGGFEPKNMDEYVGDLKTWLSGVMDYQETCIDAFQNTTGDAGEKMKGLLKTSSELSSNALAMVTELTSMLSSLHIPGFNRRLLQDEDYGPQPTGPPEDPNGALHGHGRALLQDEDYGPQPTGPPEDPNGALHGRGRALLQDEDYGPQPTGPPEDPNGALHGRGRALLNEEDYGPQPTGPPEDPNGALHGRGRALLNEEDYGPKPTGPPEDPNGALHGRGRALLQYEDYGPQPTGPPEDPNGALHGHGRALLQYEDYGPQPTGPPEDPNGALHGRGRALLNEEDYGPQPTGPPEDPNGALHGRGRALLNEEDYGPQPTGPPEDPNGALHGRGRALLNEEDYGPQPTGPPEDPNGALHGRGRALLNEEDYGPQPTGPPEDPNGAKLGHGRSLLQMGDYNFLTLPREEQNSGRRLLTSDGLPGWIGGRQRFLLQATPKPNAIVALDGSGQFKSINEALKTVPPKNIFPFVILIKAGIYNEYVDVPRHVDNVVMIGEGATKTKITGNKNFIDGVNTFKTATFAVNGDGFMAKDIGFENSAGAAKHQAVALRVSGDRAIFFRCQMDGYQDTLYAHTYRQFYRDCTITGTIDFIFGDAAAVFQNCKMIVRKPMDNQGCMVTAQGRKERRSTGGTILQNCYITGEPALMQAQPPVKSYLGRPWKEYSRTIVMQSFIDSNIVPEGWSPWTGNFGQDTCQYAEFQNRGPGSNTSRRVPWKGVQRNLSPQAATAFTPGRFFQGDAWIPVAAIPYDSALMKV